MFSKRLGTTLEENELWRALSHKRARGDEVLDLTESNPTRVGLDYPNDEILEAMTPPELLSYEPSPVGLLDARQAIATYYDEHGADVSPDDIVVTSSTSEAYSFLFKLLCDPGDAVLVPRPSYPLHEFLASLDAVEPVPYSLEFGVPDSLPPRCRGIIAVHPNNPTGSFVPPAHADTMIELSETQDVALIVDEVFLDYGLAGAPAHRSFAGSPDKGLVFTLSGFSKLAGLPQMKLGWIVLAGAPGRRREALDRLTHIADTYLSVGAPVQHAATRLLEIAPGIRTAIQQRVEHNLETLDNEIRNVPEVSCPAPEAGWYTVVRLPAIASSEEWAIDILERASVYLHPGSMFGIDGGAHLVIGLLSPPERFRDAIDRVLALVADRINSSRA
jgi:alanine-synthesizing transaminase